jgi:hypothetical protein
MALSLTQNASVWRNANSCEHIFALQFRIKPRSRRRRRLDHGGIVWNWWTGALAHLGVARANALQSKTLQGADADAARVRALAVYKDFLTLWKDTDPTSPS